MTQLNGHDVDAPAHRPAFFHPEHGEREAVAAVWRVRPVAAGMFRGGLLGLYAAPGLRCAFREDHAGVLCMVAGGTDGQVFAPEVEHWSLALDAERLYPPTPGPKDRTPARLQVDHLWRTSWLRFQFEFPEYADQLGALPPAPVHHAPPRPVLRFGRVH